MSLINQMLKDLEQRAKRPAQTDLPLSVWHGEHSEQHNKNLIQYGLAIGLLLGLAFIGWQIFHPKHSQTTITQTAANVVPTAPTPSPAVQLQSKLPEAKPELLNDPSDFPEKMSVVKKPTPETLIETEYQRALSYINEGHKYKAMQVLTSLLNKFPDDSPARLQLAILSYESGNKDQAKKLLQVGLQQQPFYPPYIQLKARILASEGKILQARRLLEYAPPSIKDNPDYFALIAALYQQQGESGLAANLYEKLLSLQSNNAVWWVGLGVALENLGKSSQALEAYARAANSDDINPTLRAFVESKIPSLTEVNSA